MKTLSTDVETEQVKADDSCPKGRKLPNTYKDAKSECEEKIAELVQRENEVNILEQEVVHCKEWVTYMIYCELRKAATEVDNEDGQAVVTVAADVVEELTDMLVFDNSLFDQD